MSSLLLLLPLLLARRKCWGACAWRPLAGLLHAPPSAGGIEGLQLRMRVVLQQRQGVRSRSSSSRRCICMRVCPAVWCWAAKGHRGQAAGSVQSLLCAYT